ncbi:hypothetical protein PsorP6_009211 [Peronosclerospora sorghi]|uniref:Uncharacterized protein n=1 Tax=Peronosclerospora sorghi TaxID=230839 RepID=A0ACC0W1M1_9STRA|nr:hypothetical protein PsorP6_009211 [Peronosclerospora sorghi]
MRLREPLQLMMEDVRVTFCVISFASLFGILTDELKSGVVNYTYEGGFGGEPGNELMVDMHFVPSLPRKILGAVDQIGDLPGLLHWLANRQMPFEGGYQGRTNKLVDGCYSFWQGAVPALLCDVLRERYGEDIHYQCTTKYYKGIFYYADKRLRAAYAINLASRVITTTHAIVLVHGDGRDDPVVYGDGSNLLKRTHPAYNIADDKVMKTIEYLKAKGHFQPE